VIVKNLALGIAVGNLLVGLLALLGGANVPIRDVLAFGTFLGVLGGGFAATQAAVFHTAKDKTSQANDNWYKKDWLDGASEEEQDDWRR
jgi:hypothetical protein